jgi:hypothetical protein
MNRNSFSIAILTLVALTCTTAAWARKYTLTTSTAVPAAKGEIDTKTDKNGNTQIDLKVEHLAKATGLTPPGTAYVIWFQQAGSADPQNEGQLQVGNNLKGQFKSVSPMKNFEVFATVETDPLVKMPTGQQIFHTTVQP